MVLLTPPTISNFMDNEMTGRSIPAFIIRLHFSHIHTIIFTAIRQQDSSTFIAPSDIRNDRKAIRASELAGRTPIEALLDGLSTEEWVFDIKRDSENHIQYLFFAHRKQVELLLINPDVLFIDCTYRINKYRLPLMHILGCTSLGKFFSVGFYFIRNKIY